ncbi:MAG TPA: hypothetical protein VK797_22340 [Tepidisphaeraceae bacterium]|jgi:hypothetical protein|nr:hypothetical protein [Tepidisphaeraceae bacterium]
MTRVYDEIIDFIAGGSSPSDVAEFQPSEEVRERVADLIDRQRTSTLSPAEADELDRYLELEHMMRLAKARARGRLAP